MSYRLQKNKLALQTTRNKVSAREGQMELLEQQRAQAVGRKSKAELQLGVFDKVQILLQKTSDFARQQAKIRMEEIVTSALGVVFGKNYKFWIELTVRGNRPEADYWLENDGVKTQLKPPDYDRGGGIVDIISMALRLAVGELEQIKGPLLLDELGKHVSAEYAPNVAYFLKEYSQKMQRQIILVTHSEALAEAGDASFQVSQTNGKSSVKTV